MAVRVRPEGYSESRREFYIKNRERLLAERKHRYDNNINGYAERSRDITKNRMLAASAVIEAAKDAPCADCGVKYPPFVMDFDHVRGTKGFNIAPNRSRSLELIKAEIAKCEVVCSNCHRARTHARKVASNG